MHEWIGDLVRDVRLVIVVDAPVGDHRDEYTRESFENEDPRPCGLTPDATHLRDASCQYTTKSSSECSSTEKQSHAEATFVPNIPLTDVVIDSGEQAPFKHSQESTRCHQARVVLDEAL